uniref:NADH-ubiquinone oxidoreductase chain 1 n=1 Tax=Opegrapha vulgata TaxID=543791 RepID=A0A286QSJ3_9PEZI|nr:NADH dehydrogenase subunit 1 [Opegrapha vulgata]ASB29442.1 NADH dehydrogenase subunit 1 [Opegrapha vulgata]
MASMQRRLGPNVVGYYGLLQAFADALKLLLKEYVSPTQANIILFFLGPVVTLIFSLLGYAVIPYAAGLSLFDSNLGVLYLLAVSSIATYGILLAGWSANSKYAFLGSLRSTAQLISYELVLSSAIFLVVLLTSSLNITVNVEVQKCVWFILPLLPVFIIFFIAAVAETNRAPFDLAEAESELVSGFMTEHSAVIFVFFFLAEYASIVLMCIMISILFLGGYNVNFGTIIIVVEFIHYLFLNFVVIWINIIYSIDDILDYLSYLNSIIGIDYLTGKLEIVYTERSYITNNTSLHYMGLKLGWIYNDREDTIYEDVANFSAENWIKNITIVNVICSLSMAIKSFIMIFMFIWVRASFPRIRFDQLMSYCWTVLLPLIFAFIVFVPCLIYLLQVIPDSILFL